MCSSTSEAKRKNNLLSIYEESVSCIYPTDAKTVLARGVNGSDAAKVRANQIRTSQNLKWNQLKLKSERGRQSVASGSLTSVGRRSGDSLVKTYGQSSYVDYVRNYNPNKGHLLRVSGMPRAAMPTWIEWVTKYTH